MPRQRRLDSIPMTLFLLLVVVLLIVASSSSHILSKDANEELLASHLSPPMLETKMCVDGSCKSDCFSYRTPVNACYNGQELFPDDESWSEWDVLDEPTACAVAFRRTFFATKDSTCAGAATDVYTLPTEDCVGPFGDPRPWGTFSYVNDTNLRSVQ